MKSFLLFFFFLLSALNLISAPTIDYANRENHEIAHSTSALAEENDTCHSGAGLETSESGSVNGIQQDFLNSISRTVPHRRQAQSRNSSRSHIRNAFRYKLWYLASVFCTHNPHSKNESFVEFTPTCIDPILTYIYTLRHILI